ncbi:hypothetical protein NBRC116596_24210 [Litorivita sp. NS0012-18]
MLMPARAGTNFPKVKDAGGGGKSGSPAPETRLPARAVRPPENPIRCG